MAEIIHVTVNGVFSHCLPVVTIERPIERDNQCLRFIELAIWLPCRRELGAPSSIGLWKRSRFRS